MFSLQQRQPLLAKEMKASWDKVATSHRPHDTIPCQEVYMIDVDLIYLDVMTPNKLQSECGHLTPGKDILFLMVSKVLKRGEYTPVL